MKSSASAIGDVNKDLLGGDGDIMRDATAGHLNDVDSDKSALINQHEYLPTTQ